jgi:predicted transcriptional regulator of viral defense system
MNVKKTQRKTILMEKANELKKVSMNLNTNSINNVDELSLLFGEKNKTRVISSALEIAKAIFKQIKAGKHIIIRDEDGSEQEITFIAT